MKVCVREGFVLHRKDPTTGKTTVYRAGDVFDLPKKEPVPHQVEIVRKRKTGEDSQNELL
jgi:hypothetical protein